MTLLKSTLSKGVTKLTFLGSQLFQKLPLKQQSLLAQPIIDQIFNRCFEADDLTFLQAKILRLEISDIAHQQNFTLKDNKIVVTALNKAPDVTLSGTLNAFITLMKHQQDPDTLFFQRKLMISGDTELGLEIKSLFDYFEFNALPNYAKHSINLLQSIIRYQ